MTKDFDDNQANLEDLKNRLKELIKNNRNLEDMVRELLAEKDQKPKFDFEKENILRENKSL